MKNFFKPKRKMVQQKNKTNHPGENDACHIIGINKYLLKKKNKVLRKHIVRMNGMKKAKKKKQISITNN